MSANYYKVLGITRRASQDEIRKAYRRIAKKVHPDTNSAPSATEDFVKLNEAYAILSDPKKRATYNYRLDHPNRSRKKSQPSRDPSGKVRVNTNNRSQQEAYEAWVREARERAREHARMKYEEFQQTTFYRTEQKVQNTIGILVLIFGMVLSVFIMSIPIILVRFIDWKYMFSAIFFVPAGVALFRAAFLAFKEYYLNGEEDEA